MDPSAGGDPQAREARMLAAIVFTDVVGFSKLASQNEARVYVALQRDMGVMTNLCRAHGGQVLNTMGDGMLLCFASAVDAMSCAVEIQRTLYNQSHTLPQVDVLHHRIGVHLGDVIMNGDNVFGDGVNVAARLQSIARPDAVCFSHTVYEVIKNKLKVDATYLGPRQLKNLGEPVRVWQIPPVGETAPPLDAPTPEIMTARKEELNTGAGGAKGAMLIVGAIALIALLGFAVSRLKAPPPLASPPRSSKPAGGPYGPGATDGSPDGSTTGTTPVTQNPPKVDAEFVRHEVETLRQAYDFQRILEVLDKNGAVVPDLLAKRPQFAQLAQMRTYLDRQLAMTNGATTINVAFPEIGAAQVHLSNNVLFINSDSHGSEQIPWPVKPDMYIAVLAAVCMHPVDGSSLPNEGPSWIQDFANEYGVSAPSNFE